MTADNNTTTSPDHATDGDNKAAVQRAMAHLLTTGDLDALASLLTDDFVHHRSDATTSTKTEWLADVRTALPHVAAMHVEIHQLLADGDHVVMHTRRRLPDPGAAIAVVDIWRFDGGRIAEAWEIIEPLADAAAHRTWWEPAVA